MEDKSKVATPKPVSCKIDETVKRTTFDLADIRAFVESTTAKTIEVETDDGRKSILFVDWIRRILDR